MAFIQAHWGAILLGLWVIGTALYRALPKTTADWQWGQVVLDWVRGILGALPSTAPKLTKAELMARKAQAGK